MGKNAVTYLLKNALAEGSEEITSDAVNWLADVMISQDKSEWQETLFHYQVMGFSEDEAFLAAMKEQGRKMLKDGAAGAITGTITAGGRLAGSKIGDGIQSYRNYREAVQNGRIYHDLNNMTKGDLARSLGYMDIEQEYKTSLPVALEAESRSGSEIRSLLEANGYSLEGEFGDRNTDISLRESKAQHSIQTLPDGKKYVKADRQVISGNNPQKWAGQITNYINQQIRKGKNVMLVTDNDDLLQITQNTAGKAQFRNLVLQPSGFYQPMTDDQYAVKLRAEGHIDELAQISSRGNKIVPDSDGKHKAMASNGWNYRTAYFEDADGKYYQLTISTALGKNGNTVYNIAKIKERTPAGGESKVKTSGALPFRGSSAENGGAQVQFKSSNASIPISTEKVNSSGMNLEQSIRIYGVDPQKAALVTRLANDTGAKVLFDGTLTEECEGYEKDGVIYLNPNANNIKAIFSHELTHVLERTDSYQTLRNMVLSQYGNNTALQNALDAKRKNYQAHGVELTRAEAAQELVAEFAGERLFTDISAIRRLASYDLNLAGKIGSAISRMASKATGNPEKSFLRNAEHMYTQAILKNSGLSPTEARFLLESNGYSLEGVSEQGRRRQPFNNLEKGGEINTNSNGLVDKNQEIPYSDLEDRSQWEHYKEILGINAPQDFTDFCNLKYSDEWDSFKAYAHSIENGWLTALAGFDLYKNISSEIDHVLVGETLPNGIKITGKSDHYIDRTIGSVEDRRTGVSVQDALQTIKKPAKTDPVVSRPNGRSQRFIGEKATVTINPDTGNLIQVNPTKSYSKKKRRS